MIHWGQIVTNVVEQRGDDPLVVCTVCLGPCRGLKRVREAVDLLAAKSVF